MTTYKGLMRSANATFKRIEKAEKMRLKEELLDNAAQAVETYNEFITTLTSFHKDVSAPVDWKEILRKKAPEEPGEYDLNERKATKKLENFMPSFFDRLLRLEKSKKNRLEKDLIIAQKKDLITLEKAKKEYIIQKEEWEKFHRIANGVLDKDTDACKDAVHLFDPFSKVQNLGTQVNFTFNTNYVVADLLVQTDEVIPRQVLSLTATGKLSKKDLPVSKFNDLYQDHICSCLLRIGREVLALLPVDFVIVNIISDLLNTSSGRIEQSTILSAAIFPETLEKLHFDKIDPSDSLRNFKHNMDFSKTTGFKPVEKLEGKCF